jgi:hypothetical protein
MREPRKKKTKKESFVPSLSSVPEDNDDASLNEVREVVFSSINNTELQRALDSWLKKNIKDNKLILRDLKVLKDIITEYLDAYILFGYNLEGERVIVQHFTSPKDRDAVMEFLKTIFIRQQHENFLDIEEDDEE